LFSIGDGGGNGVVVVVVVVVEVLYWYCLNIPHRHNWLAGLSGVAWFGSRSASQGRDRAG